MAMTDGRVVRGLWLLLALTSPFFGVEFLRYNNEALHIHVAIPTAVQFAIVGIALLGVVARSGRIRRPPALARKWGRLLIGFIALFLFCHAVGVARAFDYLYAAREFFKLALGILTFLTVVAFFPRDPRFMERFWTFAIWGAAFLLGYLIYLHGFVFKSSQLAGVDRLGREGVNQLTGHVVYVMPFAIAWTWSARRKVAALVPLLVIVIAWIYSGSRGAWIAVVVGGGVMAMEFWKTLGLRKVLMFLVVAAVAGAAGLYVLNEWLPAEQMDFIARARYLYDPESVPELQSFDDRSARIIRALKCCAMTSPLVGVGLTNTQSLSGLPHNDYVSILGDMGVFGLGLFGLILYAVYKCCWPRRRSQADVWWVSLGTHAVLVALVVFFNTIDKFYTVQTFWLFAGLALVAGEIERSGVPIPSRDRRVRSARAGRTAAAAEAGDRRHRRVIADRAR